MYVRHVCPNRTGKAVYGHSCAPEHLPDEISPSVAGLARKMRSLQRAPAGLACTLLLLPCLASTVQLGGGTGQPPPIDKQTASADTCFRTIRALALHDSQLGENTADQSQSRLHQKQASGTAAAGPVEFAALMAPQFSNGSQTGFSCGYTSSWVRGR